MWKEHGVLTNQGMGKEYGIFLNQSAPDVDLDVFDE